ncbi:Receptor-type tyrosine-protein kinase FLT3 [Folsomia candida]|uniref:Receptor-type tyrosine-protein kinase FLT3 n=1 Tax=Folsomia candida TaxID=158441 RepID=A0A226E8N0_FOLCA|nr:Receptor-type tyrosine-protein kinase FLT3 [Folsomia candida]
MRIKWNNQQRYPKKLKKAVTSLVIEPHQQEYVASDSESDDNSDMEIAEPYSEIHSDIAARNVLLDDKLVAKISDFGMSRKLYDYQMYATLEQKEYPWKWMAPESLDRLQFTHQSDVWSYGVLLWEIYSLGETPWPGLTWTSDFVHKLHNGLRLERPFWADKNM